MSLTLNEKLRYIVNLLRMYRPMLENRFTVLVVAYHQQHKQEAQLSQWDALAGWGCVETKFAST